MGPVPTISGQDSKAQIARILFVAVPEALLETNSESRFLREAKYAAEAVVIIARSPFRRKMLKE